MRKGSLTKEQAMEIVGGDAVKRIEKVNCDYTNRVQTDGDDAVEFSAFVKCEDKDGTPCTLLAYYYQDAEDLEGVEDLSDLDWEINGYEVV